MQCSGVTQSGVQCARNTDDPSGFCYQHRGQTPPSPGPEEVRPAEEAEEVLTEEEATEEAPVAPPPAPAPRRQPPWAWLTWITTAAIVVIVLGSLVLMLQRLSVSASPTKTPTPVPINTPTSIPTSMPMLTPAMASYALAGQMYESPQGKTYNARWEASGWLWQSNLPPALQRQWHSVAITIEEGDYVFNGVACRLYLDTERNGLGSQNPLTVSYGNSLPFVVETVDGGQAWALVECDGGAATGFSIEWQGP